MEDTIAAISTPVGEGGIAIVRISGPRALAVADAIFVSTKGLPSTYSSHTIHFGRITGNHNQTLDEVLLSVMRSPRTYTTEDMIEINCHGGIQLVQSVLSQCLRHGARIAEPGEFTKRAFLNGRIDLAQAEAVMDVITAKTARAQAVAEHALEGHLSRKVETIRQQLLALLVNLEAHIDFPDEDISPTVWKVLENDLIRLIADLEQLLATAKEGKILRAGVSITIFGRPNVGKSSLMNALLGEERSIVTPIPGTTRDTIEELANIRGIPVRFTDTAGIRKPRGKAEDLGIQRSHNALRNSNISILVLDSSKPLSTTDITLLNRYNDKSVIKVLNKIDLPRKLISRQKLQNANAAEVSAVNGQGIESLKDRIEQDLIKTSAPSSFALEVVINDRHADALRRSIKELKSALNEIQSNTSVEIIAQQISVGLSIIGEIVGKTTTEDLLNSIFSKFCIGK